MFKKWDKMTVAFILLFGFLVGVGIFSIFKDKNSDEPKTKPFPTTTSMKYDEKKQPTLGKEDAPVTVVGFSDYNCPHCQDWEQHIFPVLKERLIDTGKIKFISVNYQFMRATSTYAGMAGEMVYKHAPEKFWDFQEETFKLKGAITIERLAELVNKNVPSLKKADIEKDLKDQKFIDEVISDRDYGTSLHVQGTPAFVVNGKLVDGINYDDIEKAVNEELKKVETKKN